MLGFNLNDLLYWTIWWGSLGGNLLLMLCLVENVSFLITLPSYYNVYELLNNYNWA